MAERMSLGTRYICFQCGSKFYDLGRTDPLCPRCGADQRERPPPPPTPSGPAPKKWRGRRRDEDEFGDGENNELEDLDESFSAALSEEFSAEFGDDMEEEEEEEFSGEG